MHLRLQAAQCLVNPTQCIFFPFVGYLTYNLLEKISYLVVILYLYSV